VSLARLYSWLIASKIIDKTGFDPMLMVDV